METLKSTNARIAAYLETHGPMSGRDLCRDLALDDVHVEMAHDRAAIQRTFTRCRPEPGGSGPWYRATRS